MLLAGQNKLQHPKVVETKPFEQALSEFKQHIISFIAQSDLSLSLSIAETLENDAELITKIVQACVYVQQVRQREINHDALQMFVNWATGSNLDAKVRDLGLTRQLIKAGDENAFPPVPGVYESDDDLRHRYFLTLLGFSTAGAEHAYIYHCMTLGERPEITVNSESDRVVNVRYEFKNSEYAGKVKDASVQRPAPGKVLLTILSRDGNGIPSAELLDFIREYFERGDVAPATDDITVQAVEIINYSIDCTIYVNAGASPEIIKNDALERINHYANEQKRLGAAIEPSFIGHLLHSAGAVRYDLPLNLVNCSKSQAPVLSNVTINVALL